MAFSDRLTSILKSKNITEYRLSKLTKLSRSTINALTSGASKNPNAETLAKIAVALNISISDLVGEKIDIDDTNAKLEKSKDMIEQVINATQKYYHPKYLDVVKKIEDNSLDLNEVHIALDVLIANKNRKAPN